MERKLLVSDHLKDIHIVGLQGTKSKHPISMEIHGYQWISMDVHGYPWISMESMDSMSPWNGFHGFHESMESMDCKTETGLLLYIKKSHTGLLLYIEKQTH